jgi:hypothetical protein
MREFKAVATDEIYVDDTYTRVTNGIRDAIAPGVTIFVKYTLEAAYGDFQKLVIARR